MERFRTSAMCHLDRLISSMPLSVIRAAARGLRRGVEIVRNGEERVVSVGSAARTGQRALLSYNLAPFVDRGAAGRSADASSWTSLTLVRNLVARGWSVDVVSDRNVTFLPTARYGMAIASRPSLPRLVPRLSPDCVKICFLDRADSLFQHAAECIRLLQLKDRRSVVLPATPDEPVTRGLENADHAIVQGNDFTLGTYRYARIPLYRVPVPALDEGESPAAKDFEQCRSRFLWLGDRGLVKQGLDRTLEAFTRLPDLHLAVSGRLRDEPRFSDAYRRELHQTPNIHVVAAGRLDGRQLASLADNCIAVVFPSCSEGQANQVIACMTSGLIPIVSLESGVDVGDFGIMLRESSVDAIAAAVGAVSSLPIATLRRMATASWEFVRRHHHPSVVAQRYDEVLTEILARKVARD